MIEVKRPGEKSVQKDTKTSRFILSLQNWIFSKAKYYQVIKLTVSPPSPYEMQVNFCKDDSFKIAIVVQSIICLLYRVIIMSESSPFYPMHVLSLTRSYITFIGF